MSQGPCVVHNGITCDTKHVCATSTGCSDPWENQQFDLQKKAIQKRRWVFQPLIFRDYLGLGRVLFNSSCWFHVSKNQYYAFTSLPTCTSWLLRYLDNKITIKDTKTSTSRTIHLQKLRCERYSASLKAASAFSFCSSAKSWRKKGALKHFAMRKISFRTTVQEVKVSTVYTYLWGGWTKASTRLFCQARKENDI